METCKNNFGTAKQKSDFYKLLKNAKTGKTDIMPTLQSAQKIYGFLPTQVIKKIAETLKIAESEVYGVVTFYSQFNLTPKAKYNVNICLGTACFVAGSKNILSEVEKLLKIKVGQMSTDGKWLITTCRCLGCCGLAPVLTINDKTYGNVKLNQIETLLKDCK